jgi:hypothetical protein
MVGRGCERLKQKRRIESPVRSRVFRLLLRIPNKYRKSTAPSPALASIAFVDDMRGPPDRARVKASSEIVTDIQGVHICTSAHND